MGFFMFIKYKQCWKMNNFNKKRRKREKKVLDDKSDSITKAQKKCKPCSHCVERELYQLAESNQHLTNMWIIKSDHLELVRLQWIDNYLADSWINFSVLNLCSTDQHVTHCICVTCWSVESDRLECVWSEQR